MSKLSWYPTTKPSLDRYYEIIDKITEEYIKNSPEIQMMSYEDFMSKAIITKKSQKGKER